MVNAVSYHLGVTENTCRYHMMFPHAYATWFGTAGLGAAYVHSYKDAVLVFLNSTAPPTTWISTVTSFSRTICTVQGPRGSYLGNAWSRGASVHGGLQKFLQIPVVTMNVVCVANDCALGGRVC